MKNWLKKYTALILALVLVCAVCLMFASRKDGMFIDEIYTYGLANSRYAPYVTDIKDGDLINKVMTREELTDYLTVGEDDRFDAGSVYYNQTRDVHPPLYYWLFNFVSSLVPGEFSMWTGLILDLVIYLLALFVLYKLAFMLFDSRLCAVSAVLIYGLSTIGLSTMLMIRMYVLLTLLTVLLAYLIARLMRERKALLYPLIGLTIFAGLMTQYYFVFYAFFVCLAYDIYALTQRDYRSFFIFSLLALLGVVCLVLAFPACLDQLFADALVSGGDAVNKLKDVSQYASRLVTFARDSLHRMRAAWWIAFILLATIVVHHKEIAAGVRAHRLNPGALVLIVPAFVSFVIVAIASPVPEIRYIYNLVPLLILAVIALLHIIELSDTALSEKPGTRIFIGAAVCAMCLWQARCLPPDYLYREYSGYDALLQEHADAPCVYIDDNYFSPITYDMLQLMNFDDFLVTNDTGSDALLDYIGDAPETVVFIDISKEWASGYDAEEILAGLEESTGYTEQTALYSNGFSAVYLLKGGDA